MLKCRRNFLLAVYVLVVLLTPVAASAHYFPAAGHVPIRHSLPTGIDLMESGLYWMQDMTSAYDPRDPSSIISLMEQQAARFFDFAYMSWLIAGPAYARLDILERSHFQNRIRDRLFELLARKVGMYNVRMPHFRPLLPLAFGDYTWRAGGEFYHPGGAVIRLHFYFYLTPRGWRIYDVSSNGVSAVADLRRHFQAQRFSR